MPGRTIAIGDIHGCSAALQTVLSAIGPTADDTIVTLGDYIDRGPDSRGVVEQLLALDKQAELIPLMGNHELMLLVAKEQPEHLPWWRDCGGLATLLSYHEQRLRSGAALEHPAPEPATSESPKEANDSAVDQTGSTDADEDTDEKEKLEQEEAATGIQLPGPEIIPQQHLDFFDSCSLAYETETHIFVHANYDAQVPINEQDEEVLLWQHLNVPPGEHISKKKVIVGHTPQLSGEILDLGYLVCIDTYCFGTGWLTAYDVETGEQWQANRNGELRQHSV